MNGQLNQQGLGHRPKSDLIGRVLGGRYRILRELAKGGLGTVYEALHIELERTVAIKVLSEDVARHAETIQRFQREAQTASQIGHPNIVDVHDLGRTDRGAPYLAMERLEGRDLSELLDEKRSLPPERVIEIVAPVANALDTVHTRGIVHRDVKPANIFLARRVDGSEQLKLLDFGLAAFHERGDRLTQMGNVVGTPHYMPPEGAEGELAGPRGDLYSLAAVAYECLCGELPFDAELSTGVLVKKVARRAPTMGQRTERAYPPAVEAVLAQALERDPEARQATCGEFVSELSAAIRAGDWSKLDDPAARAIASAPVTQSDVIESGQDMPMAKTTSANPSVPPAASALTRATAESSRAEPRDAEARAEPGRRPVAAPHSPANEPPRSGLKAGLVGGVLALALVGAGGFAIFGVPGGRSEGAIEASSLEPREAEAGPLEAETAETAAPDPVPEPTAAAPEVAPPEVVPDEPDAPPVEASSRGARRRGRAPAPQAAGETPSETPTVTPAVEAPTRNRAAELVDEARGLTVHGQFARAAQLYRAATQANPRSADAWVGLGLSEQRQGHRPEAIAAYRRFLALRPSGGTSDSVRTRLAELEGG